MTSVKARTVSLIHCVSVALGTEKQLCEYLLNEGMNEICMDHYLPSKFHQYNLGDEKTCSDLGLASSLYVTCTKPLRSRALLS